MRSILFKLSREESDAFELVRVVGGKKLTPKKFFLAALQKEVGRVMSEAEVESE